MNSSGSEGQGRFGSLRYIFDIDGELFTWSETLTLSWTHRPLLSLAAAGRLSGGWWVVPRLPSYKGDLLDVNILIYILLGFFARIAKTK